MLVALCGKLAGYDGQFDFSSGGNYDGKVPYVLMRMFVASFGALVVPLSYIAAIQMRFSQVTSLLVAFMALFGTLWFLFKDVMIHNYREWIHWYHSIDPVGFHADLLHRVHFCIIRLVS